MAGTHNKIPEYRLFKRILWPAVIICLLILATNGKEIAVRAKGDIVKATLVSKASSYSTKAGGKVCAFQYEEIRFINRVDAAFLDGVKVGDTFQFYHLPQFRNEFVDVRRPLFSVYSNFIAGCAFTILLVVAFIYVYKSEDSNSEARRNQKRR